ncbi:MAG: MBL fold metallo-hydrolase, partial [Candidatus Aenigmatarchaeota archaeon]
AKQNNVDLKKLDGILLSHRHPDHAGDINTVIEAMCGDEGGEGTLITERKCVSGKTRVVDEYHERLPKDTYSVGPGEKYRLGELEIKTTESKHYSDTVGFVLDGSVRVGYTSDGPYFEGQEDYFKDTDYLILNTMIPKDKKSEKHMTVEGAIKMINGAKPRRAILNHFGFSFMRAGFKQQKDYVEDRTGTEVLYSRDGMEIDLGGSGDGDKNIEDFTG